MALTFPSELSLEFARKARLRREDERRLTEEGKRTAIAERDKEEEHDHQEEQDSLLLLAATAEELDAFREDLDVYDTATVEALQENEEEMAKIRERMKQLLNDAYTLPDGRKVFKSEDGKHVYDQNGVKVKGIDPELIDDGRPRFEEYERWGKQLEDLSDERDDLLKYQTELDNARTLADDGDLSKGELEDLEKKLKADAPAAVAEKVSSPEAVQVSPLAMDAQPEKAQQPYLPPGKLDMPPI